jgi:CheY-like chemotaxis protein
MSKKVYLVDDDVDLVESLSTSLKAFGYTVEFQNDDDNLVDNIRQFNPSAIVLDVMFPGDDSAGFKMARTIRHHDDIKNIPIVMLTAVNEKGEYPGTFSNDDIDDMYMPVTAFLDKPVDPKNLKAKIEELT